MVVKIVTGRVQGERAAGPGEAEVVAGGRRAAASKRQHGNGRQRGSAGQGTLCDVVMRINA